MNFDLSANVSCHKFNVPFACLVTIDMVGDGGAVKISGGCSSSDPSPAAF